MSLTHSAAPVHMKREGTAKPAKFALALAVEKATWRRRILLRGVTFWSVAASLSGAYTLGVHEIDRVPFQYTLTPTLESAPSTCT